MTLRTITFSSFSVLAFLACGGPGNTGIKPISEDLVREIPWTNGRAPVVDENGHAVYPFLPTWPKIASGIADPGSAPANCDAQEDVILSDFWIESFEPAPGDEVGSAPAWASYDDSSDGSFRSPAEINMYDGLLAKHASAAWGLPAQQLEGTPGCNGPSSWALHYVGGRFNRYGAGLTHPLASLILRDDITCPNEEVCVKTPESGKTYDNGIPLAPTTGSGVEDGSYKQPELKNVWNLESYDGIAFWARRGPEGQGALTVMLHDQFTSDDLNRENNTFCERVKPCRTKCLNELPCTEVPGVIPEVNRCWDPEAGPYPLEGLSVDAALEDALYPRCGTTACSSPSTFEDRDFDGKECRAFTFDQHESGEYCFDKGEEPPDSGFRCGDGYAKTVTISLDWKFFKVPFSELRQSGFGKISPGIDLKSVSTLVFTFTHGWVDAYIDDVAFYREKP